jgi:hypothetical protein
MHSATLPFHGRAEQKSMVFFFISQYNLQCMALPAPKTPNRSPNSDVNTLQVPLIGIIFHGIRGAVFHG